MTFRSKLPDVGTTIFSVISRRASELGAINLGQGFPDFDVDPLLAQLVFDAMQQGHNQYAPMPGVPALLEAIAAKLNRSYAVSVDPGSEITVKLGATEAIYSAVQALVGPGDEAIVFDPSYDSYDPAVRLAGATCMRIPLEPPAFRYDWDRIRSTVNGRTRLLIINTPHNPACTCLADDDLRQLERLVHEFGLYVIADEVYEHMVFDGRAHRSVLSIPALRARAVAVFSFGKMLGATGLRIGYAVAPADLTAEVRKVHQFNTFTIATALQVAIARYLQERAHLGARLSDFYAGKRDRLIAGLRGSGLTLRPSAGSFFQLIDYSALSRAGDTVMAEQLLEQARVASIPLSVFYRQPPPMTLLRLCFAKQDQTLDAGAARLQQYLQGMTR